MNMFCSNLPSPQTVESDATDLFRTFSSPPSSNRSSLLVAPAGPATMEKSNRRNVIFHKDSKRNLVPADNLTVVDILMKVPSHQLGDDPQQHRQATQPPAQQRRRIIVPASARTVRTKLNVSQTDANMEVLPHSVTDILARASQSDQRQKIHQTSQTFLGPKEQMPKFATRFHENSYALGNPARRSSNGSHGLPNDSHNPHERRCLSSRHHHQQQQHKTTMSSLDLHPQERPQELMERKNTDPVLTPVANHHAPKRSRAIAIKNNKNNALHYPEVYEPSSQESEKMYDYATWRMYNRIIDHRRSQQAMVSTGYPDALPVPMNSLNHLHGQAYTNTRTAQAAPIDPLSQDYIHDGEVFELEI